MGVLKANLRHLYQHRGLWLYYYLCAWFAYCAAQIGRDNAHLIWMWCMLINFIAGLALGTLQREVLSKPFVYCLPGHRPVPRRIVGAVGVVLNMALCWLILIHPDVSALEVPLIMAAAFSLGLAVYLLGARSMFTLSDRVAPYLAVQIIFMGLLFVKGPALDDLIVAGPEFVMAFALAACVGFWVNLRMSIDARGFCGKHVQGLSDFSRASIRRNRQVRRAAHAAGPAVPARVEGAFFDRIGAFRPLSAARCVWADLYIAFAMLLSRWKRVLPACLLAVLVWSYVAGKVGSEGADRFLSKFPILSGLIVFQMVALVSLPPTFLIPVPVFSNMLLARGRRERCNAMICIGIALALCVSLVLAFVTGCTVLLQWVAPGAFGSLTRLFGGLGIVVFVASPFVLVPLGLIARLLARHLGMTIIYVFGFCIVVQIPLARYWFAPMGVPLLLAASLCCWIALIITARRICANRSLVAGDAKCAFGV